MFYVDNENHNHRCITYGDWIVTKIIPCEFSHINALWMRQAAQVTEPGTYHYYNGYCFAQMSSKMSECMYNCTCVMCEE